MSTSSVAARLPRGGRLLLLLGILLVLVLLGGRLVSTLYVDILWFDAVGYLDVFWTRTLWQWGVRLVAGAAAAAVLYANLRVVAETLGAIQIKRRVGDLEIAEKLPRSYVHWGVTGIAILVGLWFGAAIPSGAGLRSLLWFESGAWGLSDPVLGRDASFYVFTLPILSGVLTFVLVLAFLTTALCSAGYAATGSVTWGNGTLRIGRTPRTHLTLLLGFFLLLLAARFWLGRSLILLDGNSSVQGIVGFADVEARLPAYRMMAVVTLLSTAAFVWGGIKDRRTALLGSIVAVVIAGIGLGQIYPSLVQRFQVEPNELVRETPYIEHNLTFTREGFGLNRLQRRPFEYRADVSRWEGAEAQLRGFPVWSRSALLTTFREVEARFRYYAFPHVAIDRYPTPSGTEVLASSVREIDPGGIEDPNWQNLHLRKRYISGVGAVASLAARQTPEGRPHMILAGIPPEVADGPNVPPDLALTRPEVYFGSRPQLYAVLTPGEGVFEAPGGGPGEAGVDFPRGIAMTSPLRTFALAWRFRDANLLFSTEVSDSSRFVFRRQVLDRVGTVAPFLRYLEAPYPVMSGGRIVWMLDAFTATRNFPLASPHEAELRRSVSYIRNSVKITVDAVTGETRFWVVDPDDPLLAAYREAFPSLFRPLDEMPEGIRSHIRYPRTYLELQANVLQQYHQETARRFHGQQDVWTRPQELGEDSRPVPYRAEYGFYRLPGDDDPGFHLATVFVPAGRQNLTGIFVARSDPDRYGELLLLDVPVEDQVPGPRQVEALVEQDPVISQQFSLWRTGGSQVWTGHLHLVPLGGSILYMEPIFLAAEQEAIPELRRFILSDGNRVVMAPDLASSLQALREGRTPVPDAVREPGETRETRDWSDAALDILERAESRLREGDWTGFGQALEELRRTLEGARSGDPTAGGSVP